MEAVLLESGSWNKQIWQELFRMREQSLFCDIHLMGSDGKAIPAHGCVVAAASSYLRNTLCQMDHKDRNNGVIIQMPNFSSSTLESILSFIYVGNFCLSGADFQDLSSAADFLGLKDLKQLCTVLHHRYTLANSQNNLVHDQDKMLHLTQKNKDLEDTVNNLRRQLFQAQHGYTYPPGVNTVVRMTSTGGQEGEQVIVTTSKPGDMSLETDGHNDMSLYTTDEEVEDVQKLVQANVSQSSQNMSVVTETVEPSTSAAENIPTTVEIPATAEQENQYMEMMVSDSLQDINIMVKTEQEERPLTVVEASESDEAPITEKPMYVMNNNGMYLCQFCGREFPKPSFLRVHMAKHSDDKPYACNVCGMKFKYKHSVKLHMPRHGARNYRCEYCPKSFFTKREVTVHERSHTGVRPFSCSYCGKCFSQHSNLLTHKRSNHNLQFMGGARDYECASCGRRFVTRDQLGKHELTHSRIVTCNTCPASFKFRKDLKKHALEEHGEELGNDRRRPLKDRARCKECPAHFKLKAELEIHMKDYHPTVGSSSNPALEPGPTEDEQHAAETLLQIDENNEIARIVAPSNTSSGLKKISKKRAVKTVFLCPQCGMEFDSASAFSKHLPQHKQDAATA